MNRLVCALFIFLSSCNYGFTNAIRFNNKSFPADFKFGVATSAYQIEGAWNVDGKGENIWDHLLHTQPNFADDASNGDFACDFFHKYREDIANLKDLGVDHFRLSISWSRILPFGTADYVNWNAVYYYRSLITELLANGIEPLVTIYHSDLPQILQDRGGFLNPEFIEWFADYSNILFEELGDLIKIWSTFNEPWVICYWGYGVGMTAPGIKGDGQLDYICGHNLLKAHARVYHIYDDTYRSTQQGQVGIIHMAAWMEATTSHPEDIEVAETALQFMMGWFANPIFVGDYPDVMKYKIAERSYLEGRSKSRLPEFTPEEIEYIKGTHDYFGLNHYTLFGATKLPPEQLTNGTSFYLDIGVNVTYPENLPSTCISFLKVVPDSMRKMLTFVKESYNNPMIYITESGSCNFGGLEDDDTILYMKSYLSNVRDAMEKDNVDVRRFTAWSYMDSFEWTSGFNAKFGLYHVDFSKPDLPRTPKKSASVYKTIIKTHCLVEICEQ